MTNSLDPDRARLFVGPDLGPNCLQRLSADDKNTTGGERVGSFFVFFSKGSRTIEVKKHQHGSVARSPKDGLQGPGFEACWRGN